MIYGALVPNERKIGFCFMGESRWTEKNVHSQGSFMENTVAQFRWRATILGLAQ